MPSTIITMRANFGTTVHGEWLAVRREIEEVIALGTTDEMEVKRIVAGRSATYWMEKWGLTAHQAGLIDGTIIRLTYARNW